MNNDLAIGFVDVVNGLFAQSVPLAGASVAEARAKLAGPMRIRPNAVAVVNGELVDEETALVAGQVLSFVIRAGQMG